MNILMALGMIGVVGGHCGVAFIPWLQSFRMPLFIFISGYFFSDKDFLSFMKSKGKHLVLPLMLWNFFFGILSVVFLHYGLIRFGEPFSHFGPFQFGDPFSFEAFFIDPFTHGHQFMFNSPNWFVGTLVELQLLYWVLYRLCKRNHIVLSAVSLFCYGISYLMAAPYWQQSQGDFTLATEKVLILLVFYELGALYRLYGEKRDSFSVNRIAGLVILNGILLGFVGGNLYTNYAFMDMPDRIWIPLVTALSGIYLFLQMAELLKDKVPRNSLLGYIGEHTFSIMTLHLFFFWLLNTVFWKLKEIGIFPLRSFNYDQYMHNIFFRVTEHAPVVNSFYFLAGLFGSLLCVYLYERFAEPYFKKYFRFL